MAKNILTLVLTITTLLSYSREYKSMERYIAATGKTEISRKDWLTRDRETNNLQWRQACLYNFSYDGGEIEYITIEERADFLKWIHYYLLENGHTINIPIIISTIQEELLESMEKKGGKLTVLARNISQAILSDIIPALQDVQNLEEGQKLTGESAVGFDEVYIDMTWQDLYQFYLDKTSEELRQQINDLLARKGIGNKGLSKELEFSGDFQDKKQRRAWIYEQVQPYICTYYPCRNKSSVN